MNSCAANSIPSTFSIPYPIEIYPVDRRHPPTLLLRMSGWKAWRILTIRITPPCVHNHAKHLGTRRTGDASLVSLGKRLQTSFSALRKGESLRDAAAQMTWHLGKIVHTPHVQCWLAPTDTLKEAKKTMHKRKAHKARAEAKRVVSSSFCSFERVQRLVPFPPPSLSLCCHNERQCNARLD
jgi:hypothetical protein